MREVTTQVYDPKIRTAFNTALKKSRHLQRRPLPDEDLRHPLPYRPSPGQVPLFDTYFIYMINHEF